MLSQFKFNNEKLDIVTDKLFNAYKDDKGDLIKKEVVDKL